MRQINHLQKFLRQLDRTTINAFFFCLLLLFISESVYAQCSYTAGEVCTEEIEETTYTVNETWSGTICVLEDITVSGIGTTLTINSGTNVSIEPDVTITILDGASLVINNAELYASDATGMWQGIVGEPGSTIYIEDSRLYHAYVGIEISGSGSDESNLFAAENCFVNNEIGIFMHGLPGDIIHLIEDNEFTAPALVEPLDGEFGDYGILLVGTSDINTEYYQVGNTAFYTGSSTYNYFHDIAIGIRAYMANVKVLNNRIENMLSGASLPTGTPIDEIATYADGNVGILSTSDNTSSNFERTLIVGLTIPTVSNINNYIYTNDDNNFIGIASRTYVNTQIYGNQFGSSGTGGAYKMGVAIRMHEHISDHDIQNNIIGNFQHQAIRSDNITGGSTFIQNNTIIRGTDPGTGMTPEGIQIDASATNQLVEIYDNTIEQVEKGMSITNHDEAIINGNIIYFDKGDGEAIGILAQNCEDITIHANYTEGSCNVSTCAGGDPIAGIYVIGSIGMFITENHSEYAVIGVLIEGTNTTGNMTCNEIHDCQYGYGMRDVVVDGSDDDLGPIERPSAEPADNSWYAASSANREKHFGAITDLSELIWRYRDLDFDGTTALPNFDMPITLIDPMSGSDALIPTYDFSDYSATCGYPFRSDDDSIALALLELEFKFTRWLNSDIANSNSYADYIYKTYFWNKIQATPGLYEYLDDAFAEMYETVSNTNIPAFNAASVAIQNTNIDIETDLNAITPANTIEESLLFIYELLTQRKDGIKEGDDYYEVLLYLASADQKEFGEAVFLAQALLDTLIIKPINYEQELKRIEDVDTKISLYPNPANQYFTFTDQVYPELKYKLTVTDIKGAEVMELTEVYSGKSIDITSLANGIYYIALSSQVSTQTFSLIISR